MGDKRMGIPWRGDALRHMLATTELQSTGLSSKGAELLVQAGVFTTKEFLNEPWSDEEAGRRFASLRWRLSVLPTANAKAIEHIGAVRNRLLERPPIG
jgi:hypothetical protein